MVNQRTKTTLADDSYWDYTYDDLGQVTSGRRYTADGVQITSRQSVYDQDEIGNRVTSNTLNGYIPYTVNDDNQYIIMRDVSLTYDVAGNVNTYASWTYSWDNENRLIQVVSTSKLIKFSYDTQGRRIEKKVWNNTTGTGTPATYLKYLYDGWNLIAELNAKNSNAVVRTYSWGPEAQGVPGTLRMIADSNGVYFPAYDPNGNVMGLVKASDGTVCAQYEYLPYGEQVIATGTMASSNPIRFSTKYYDTEARLYYYGYRYYSPDMGRWISRDPIEERGGLNLYAFVNNNPVNNWDRFGLIIDERMRQYNANFSRATKENEEIHYCDSACTNEGDAEFLGYSFKPTSPEEKDIDKWAKNIYGIIKWGTRGHSRYVKKPAGYVSDKTKELLKDLSIINKGIILYTIIEYRLCVKSSCPKWRDKFHRFMGKQCCSFHWKIIRTAPRQCLPKQFESHVLNSESFLGDEDVIKALPRCIREHAEEISIPYNDSLFQYYF